MARLSRMIDGIPATEFGLRVLWVAVRLSVVAYLGLQHLRFFYAGSRPIMINVTAFRGILTVLGPLLVALLLCGASARLIVGEALRFLPSGGGRPRPTCSPRPPASSPAQETSRRDGRRGPTPTASAS